MFGADVETRFFSRDCFTNFGKLAVQALVSAAAWLRSSFSVALRIALFVFSQLSSLHSTCKSK